MKTLLPLFLLLPAFAAGSIAYMLTPPALQFTPPGGISNPNCMNDTVSCLIFSGTITPVPSTTTYLNGIQITFIPATSDLTENDNFFFAGPPISAPGYYGPSDPSYTGPIFEIDVSPTAAAGTYAGTATLLGGPDNSSEMDTLASDNFTIVVTPEPSAVWLTPLGLVLLAARRFDTNHPR